MIQKLDLHNFQSHSDSTLEFNKGMNIIVGGTDSGKTAIIRALILAIYNLPSGDAFRKIGTKESFVKLLVDNNIIIRKKGNNINEYILNKSLNFKAFGTSVPDEISEILNMDSINLQQQMDAPFLLSETSGKVAAHFNSIAKLSKIDSSLQYVQKNINTINQKIKNNKLEIKRKKQQLSEFIDTGKFEKDLGKIEAKQKRKQKAYNDYNFLLNLVYTIEDKDKIINDESGILKAEPFLNNILELYKRKDDARVKYKTLKTLTLKIFHLQVSIKDIKQNISAEKTINKLLEIYQNSKNAKQSEIDLEVLYKSIEYVTRSHETVSNVLKKLEANYKKNFPNICPLCNTKLK